MRNEPAHARSPYACKPAGYRNPRTRRCRCNKGRINDGYGAAGDQLLRIDAAIKLNSAVVHRLPEAFQISRSRRILTDFLLISGLQAFQRIKPFRRNPDILHLSSSKYPIVLWYSPQMRHQSSPFSIWAIWSIRRWWRPPSNSKCRNASTISRPVFSLTARPPMHRMLALL